MEKIRENIIREYVAENHGYVVEVRSHIGGRQEQQDSAYVRTDTSEVLALVCDGMGGAANGTLAGSLAVSKVKQCYQEYLAGSGDEPAEFLYRTMLAADSCVYQKMEGKPGGTTMLAAFIRDDLLYWLSVGDTRLYIMRDGELVQVTRDHNYLLRLGELRAGGKISEDMYQRELAKGEALISYVGMGNISLFDLARTGFRLHSRDRLLLATDGLYRVLDDMKIKEILETESSSLLCANVLINQVLAHAKQQILDNTTFVLIDVL